VYRHSLRGVCLQWQLAYLVNWNESSNASVFPQARVQKLKKAYNFLKIYESVSSGNFEVDIPSAEGAFGIIISRIG
jgi:hypothetical protein